MVQIENISEQGLEHIIMDVAEIIDSERLHSAPEHGLQLEHCWITPEGCYWLYKLLSIGKTNGLVRPRVLDALKQGTNHPETL